MHTRLDRQEAALSPPAVPPDVRVRAQHGAQSCLREGLRLWFLWATSVCWGWSLEESPQCCLALATRLRLGPPRPPGHHSWLHARCTGFVGLPTTTSLSCGTEFSTPFTLRVSMPLGGKYKRCLCLKPNVGVGGSPGLCPSCRPGLLATEGWAETRGRPPSYAQHGSSVCSPRCPGLQCRGRQAGLDLHIFLHAELGEGLLNAQSS